MFAAPASRLDDGIIHLIYVKAGISRRSLLRLFLAMEKGGHLRTNCPHVVYVKVKALHLEPYSPKGIITVDGVGRLWTGACTNSCQPGKTHSWVTKRIWCWQSCSFTYYESRDWVYQANKSSLYDKCIASEIF